ncbi:MAG: hypothetical protein ACOC9J_05085 [Persicimonas sp.]
MTSHLPYISPKALVALALGVVTFATGCPSYEDTHSGSYREVIDTSGRNSDAVQVDFFRFGDNAAAIVRFFNRDPITDDPFGEQSYCVWTSAEPFDEEQDKFRLYITRDSSQLPRSQLFGTLTAGDQMSITLVDQLTSEPYDSIEELDMELAGDEPQRDCELIEDFILPIDFPVDRDGNGQAMPDVSGYEIDNPVFAVTWVGVQAVGDGVFAPVNRHVPAVSLYDMYVFDRQRHALRYALDPAPAIPPPPDIVRMASGDTEWALGHFVVVDDSPEDRAGLEGDDWQFSWSTDSEKMVASSLQRATREGCPAGTNRFGRALLFVEGHLTDLSREMQRRIDGIDRCEADGACRQHFSVVDVCARDDHITKILLGSTHDADVSMLVTDEYLDADSIPLPRLNLYRP